MLAITTTTATTKGTKFNKIVEKKLMQESLTKQWPTMAKSAGRKSFWQKQHRETDRRIL